MLYWNEKRFNEIAQVIFVLLKNVSVPVYIDSVPDDEDAIVWVGELQNVRWRNRNDKSCKEG